MDRRKAGAGFDSYAHYEQQGPWRQAYRSLSAQSILLNRSAYYNTFFFCKKDSMANNAILIWVLVLFCLFLQSFKH